MTAVARTPLAWPPDDGTPESRGEPAAEQPGLATIVAELSAVADVIGQPDFYLQALASLGRLFDCERWLAMRYAQFASPQFLVNASLDREAE